MGFWLRLLGINRVINGSVVAVGTTFPIAETLSTSHFPLFQ